MKIVRFAVQAPKSFCSDATAPAQLPWHPAGDFLLLEVSMKATIVRIALTRWIRPREESRIWCLLPPIPSLLWTAFLPTPVIAPFDLPPLPFCPSLSYSTHSLPPSTPLCRFTCSRRHPLACQSMEGPCSLPVSGPAALVSGSCFIAAIKQPLPVQHFLTPAGQGIGFRPKTIFGSIC